EAEAVLERRKELGLRNVLAAEHAVGVEQPDLDMGYLPLVHDLAGIRGGADVFRLHWHGILPLLSSNLPWPRRGCQISPPQKERAPERPFPRLGGAASRFPPRPSPRPRSPSGALRSPRRWAGPGSAAARRRTTGWP